MSRLNAIKHIHATLHICQPPDDDVSGASIPCCHQCLFITQNLHPQCMLWFSSSMMRVHMTFVAMVGLPLDNVTLNKQNVYSFPLPEVAMQ
jgi:hypothetical protein